MKALLYLGLGLVALWIVLSVTRAVVGGLLWLVLIAGVIALVVYGIQMLTGQRHART